MIQLSPKALRFAENATRRAVTDHVLDRAMQANWRQWQAGDKPAGTMIDIPDAIAALFLRAIRHEMNVAQASADADPDVQNDVEFLFYVESALAQGQLPNHGHQSVQQGSTAA